MPRSHICPSCLTELARIRAVPDPHYGLPIVVCPGCSNTSVRTRHPDLEFWRGVRRVHFAFRTVFAKVLLMTFLSVILVFLTKVSEEVFTSFGRFHLLRTLSDDEPLSAVFACLILIASIFLMACASLIVLHKRVYVGAAIFIVVAFLFVTSDFALSWIQLMLEGMVNYHSNHRLPRSREFVPRLQRFGFLSAVSLLGMIPAIPFRKSIHNATARRFRRLLRKRRKQRGSND